VKQVVHYDGEEVMAQVEVTSSEARGDLPSVCVCCGAHATARLRTRFSVSGHVSPSLPRLETGSALDLVPLAFAVGRLVNDSSEAFSISLPICQAHESVRQRRARIARVLVKAVIILFGFSIIAAVGTFMTVPASEWNERLATALLVMAFLATLALLAAVFARWQPIGVKLGPPLILTKVHVAFIESLREHRMRKPDQQEDSPFEGLGR
jgi:hypothetical protein